MKTILGCALALITLFPDSARAEAISVELAISDDADTPRLVLPLGDDRSCASAVFGSQKTHYEVNLCRDLSTTQDPLINITLRRDVHSDKPDERKFTVRALVPRGKPTVVSKLDLKEGKQFLVTATAR